MKLHQAAWLSAACIALVSHSFVSAQTVPSSQFLTQESAVAVLHSIDDNGQFEGTLCGAAIVLSASKDRTLLLTANHVVESLRKGNDARRAAGQPPLMIGAAFSGRRGTYYAVRPLAGIFDTRLDYSVVELVPSLNTPDATPTTWNIIGNIVQSADDGRNQPHYQEVRAIGNSNCRPWFTSGSTEKVMEVGGTDIRFETRYVEKGSSGGGLFGEDGSLVGMVVSAEGDNNATARSIDVLLADLAAKQIKVDLLRRSSVGQFKPFDLSVISQPYRDKFIRLRVERSKIEEYANRAAVVRIHADYFSEKAKLKVKTPDSAVGSIELDGGAIYYGQVSRNGKYVRVSGYGVLEFEDKDKNNIRLYCKFNEIPACIDSIGYVFVTDKAGFPQYWYGWSGQIVDRRPNGSGLLLGSKGEYIWTDFYSDLKMQRRVFPDGTLFEGEMPNDGNWFGIFWDTDGRLMTAGFAKANKLERSIVSTGSPAR
jgi:hypothetical protein